MRQRVLVAHHPFSVPLKPRDQRRRLHHLWRLLLRGTELVRLIARHRAMNRLDSRLSSAEESKTHTLWNVETGQALGTLPFSHLWTKHFEFSPDGQQLLLRNTGHEFLLLRM